MVSKSSLSARVAHVRQIQLPLQPVKRLVNPQKPVALQPQHAPTSGRAVRFVGGEGPWGMWRDTEVEGGVLAAAETVGAAEEPGLAGR